MFKIDKNSLDEEKLKKEAEKNLNIFLEKHMQSLTTFTREPSLRYIASKSLEKFSLKPKEGVLYLPLSTFLEFNLDNNEILDFLFLMDKYFAFLRVLEACPIYRDEEEKGKIIEYMKKRTDREVIFSSLSHHGFSKSFLLWSIYKDDNRLRNKIEQKFDIKVLSDSIYNF